LTFSNFYVASLTLKGTAQGS